MEYTIEAKPTLYNDTLFRSQLEARWAVFMSTLHIPYLYEPSTFKAFYHGQEMIYTPDFLLGNGVWLEIKPVEPNDEILHQMWPLIHARRGIDGIYVLFGKPSPEDTAYVVYNIEIDPDTGQKTFGGLDWSMQWYQCPFCGRVDIGYSPGLASRPAAGGSTPLLDYCYCEYVYTDKERWLEHRQAVGEITKVGMQRELAKLKRALTHTGFTTLRQALRIAQKWVF